MGESEGIAKKDVMLDPGVRDGLIEHLSGFLTDARRDRMEWVLERRTRRVSVLLLSLIHI